MDELAASSKTFAPRDLARLLPAVLAGRWSGRPQFVDVQTDAPRSQLAADHEPSGSRVGPARWMWHH